MKQTARPRNAHGLVRNVLLLSLAVAVCECSGFTTDFVLPRTFPTGGTSEGVVVADFNGDGKLDIATSNWANGGNVGVLLGNGDGTFQAPATYAVGDGPFEIVAGDFNNDGFPDLAVSTLSGTYILINQGNGTFRQGATLPLYDWLAVGDFNGDGKLDLVSVSSDSNVAVVMLGNGDGTFQAGVSYPAGECTGGVAVGDFNGDGKQDLAVINNSCSWGENVNQLNILIGNGDGTFQLPVSYPDAHTPLLLAIGDFSRHGNLDVAVVNRDTEDQDAVQLFVGAGDGSFKPGNSFDVDSGYAPEPTGILVADFNSDGNSDVAVSDTSWGVSVLLGDAKGGFQHAQHYGIGNACDLSGGDFTGNHRVDVVTTCSLGGNVAILLDEANGGLRAPIAYRRLPGAENVVIGDFNGDGVPDLLVTEHPGTENSSHTHVAVSLGTGNGAFGKTIISKIPVGGDWQDHLFAAAGDFNGDGKLDVAITANTDQGPAVHILLGNGHGGLRLGERYILASGYFTGPIQTADFNHDGVLDLAASCADGICILLGKGNGTFSAPQQYSTGGNSRTNVSAITIGDFNHDGNLDLAVVNYCDYCDNSVGILFGKGDGTFGQLVAYAVNGMASAIVTADFNEDGNLDWAVTDIENNYIYVYVGDSEGKFQLSQTLAAGFAPYSLVAADFNHDGNVDLLAGDGGAGQGPTELTMLHGKGDGSFEPAVTYAVDPWPIDMAVGNLAGKGGPDLAVVNDIENVTVFLNSRSQ